MADNVKCVLMYFSNYEEWFKMSGCHTLPVYTEEMILLWMILCTEK